MSRKRVLVSFVLLGCIAATGIGYLVWDDMFPATMPAEVSPRSFGRLRAGMSPNQVREILGESEPGSAAGGGGRSYHWRSDLHTINVTFDAHDDTAYSGTCWRMDKLAPVRSFVREDLVTKCRRSFGL
jgi:hypothetical protein